MDSSVSLEISTVLNYTYKVNFEDRLKIWYRLISKNSGIEPVIYRLVSKNSDIEPALLLLHTVLLLGTVFYVKIRLNYNVSIEYRTKFRYRSVSNKTWYRTSTSSTTELFIESKGRVWILVVVRYWLGGSPAWRLCLHLWNYLVLILVFLLFAGLCWHRVVTDSAKNTYSDTQEL